MVSREHENSKSIGRNMIKIRIHRFSVMTLYYFYVIENGNRPLCLLKIRYRAARVADSLVRYESSVQGHETSNQSRCFTAWSFCIVLGTFRVSCLYSRTALPSTDDVSLSTHPNLHCCCGCFSNVTILRRVLKVRS